MPSLFTRSSVYQSVARRVCILQQVFVFGTRGPWCGRDESAGSSRQRVSWSGQGACSVGGRPSRCFGPARPGVQSRTAGAVCTLRSGLVSSPLLSSSLQTRRSATCHSSTPRGPWSSRQQPQDKTGTVRTPAREQDDLAAAAARSGRWREGGVGSFGAQNVPTLARLGAKTRLPLPARDATRRRPGGKSPHPHGPTHTPPGPRFEIAARPRTVRSVTRYALFGAKTQRRQWPVPSTHARLFSCRVVSCRLRLLSQGGVPTPRAPPNTPTTRAAAVGVNEATIDGLIIHRQRHREWPAGPGPGPGPDTNPALVVAAVCLSARLDCVARLAAFPGLLLSPPTGRPVSGASDQSGVPPRAKSA
jgi:hypothetical protein